MNIKYTHPRMKGDTPDPKRPYIPEQRQTRIPEYYEYRNPDAAGQSKGGCMVELKNGMRVLDYRDVKLGVTYPKTVTPEKGGTKAEDREIAEESGREPSDLNPKTLEDAWYRKHGILNRKERAEAGGPDADNGEWAQGCHFTEILTTEEAVKTLGKNHPGVNALLEKEKG